MYLGRIVEVGPADDVLLDPQHPYTRELLAAAPRPGSTLVAPHPARARWPTPSRPTRTTRPPAAGSTPLPVGPLVLRDRDVCRDTEPDPDTPAPRRLPLRHPHDATQPHPHRRGAVGDPTPAHRRPDHVRGARAARALARRQPVVYVLRTLDAEADRMRAASGGWTPAASRRSLTRGKADSSPAWSPDGTRVAFLRAPATDRRRSGCCRPTAASRSS